LLWWSPRRPSIWHWNVGDSSCLVVVNENVIVRDFRLDSADGDLRSGGVMSVTK
jgi:hypothetical protein